MLHFVQHDSLEVIRHAEFQAKSCVTVPYRKREQRAKMGAEGKDRVGGRKRDRHAEFWAFLCVTVPETRPKHQKAGPSRRISGKKLRDDTLPGSGNGGQRAEMGRRAETGRRFKQREEFRYYH